MGPAERPRTRPRGSCSDPGSSVGADLWAGTGGGARLSADRCVPGPAARVASKPDIADTKTRAATVLMSQPYIGAGARLSAWAGCSACDDPATLGSVLHDDGQSAPGWSPDPSELRWSVGYGPETTAWLLRPARRTSRRLPGCWGGRCTVRGRAYGPSALGAVRRPSGPDSSPPATRDCAGPRLRPGPPPMNCARQGYVVLVHERLLVAASRRLREPVPGPHTSARRAR